MYLCKISTYLKLHLKDMYSLYLYIYYIYGYILTRKRNKKKSQQYLRNENKKAIESIYIYNVENYVRLHYDFMSIKFNSL